MKRLVMFLALGMAAAACGGDGVHVATVNGSSISLADIGIESDGFDVPREPFLVALNWEIRDRVLLTAAAEEFDITLDEVSITASAAAILESVSPLDDVDPRPTLSYFETQARIGSQGGLLWQVMAEQLGDDFATTAWANTTLSNADVKVRQRFGVWRIDPEPLVYPE